jgi:hypothetical protein
VALTTIARYRNPIDAHIARARLEAEGIPSFVADEHLIGVNGFYSDVLGGVKLNVPDGWAEAARDVVARDHSVDLRRGGWPARRRPDPRLCPACGAGGAALRTEARPAAGFVCVTSHRSCRECAAEW